MTRFLNPRRLATFAAIALTTTAIQASVFLTVDSPLLTVDSPFSIDVDSAIELSGSFFISGRNKLDQYAPSIFASLPTSPQNLGIFRGSFEDPNSSISTDGEGTPENPVYYLPLGAGPTSVSGTYSNGGVSGTDTVNWSYNNLQDTGGDFGTFSGNFSFTVVSAVPEPAEYAAVAGLALGVFALVRRGRKAASC